MTTSKNAICPFSSLLKELRLQAGFASLSAVVTAAQKLGKSEPALSKAKLSQYERGSVDTIRPEVLRLLARLYKVPFETLATAWFRDRYGVVDGSLQGTLTVALPNCGQVRLELGEESITLESLDEFKRRQAILPKGTYVIVATRRFLDDTVFFDMVADNIARGIRYIYLGPEQHRSIYRHLITKLELAHPRLANKIDGTLTRFFPRYDFDSPVNQVLYALPSGQITGHIGLSVDELPVLYQVTTDRMVLRMFHSLMATIQVAEDAHLVRALKRREADFTSSVSSDCNRPLSLLQALF